MSRERNVPPGGQRPCPCAGITTRKLTANAEVRSVRLAEITWGRSRRTGFRPWESGIHGEKRIGRPAVEAHVAEGAYVRVLERSTAQAEVLIRAFGGPALKTTDGSVSLSPSEPAPPPLSDGLNRGSPQPVLRGVVSHR